MNKNPEILFEFMDFIKKEHKNNELSIIEINIIQEQLIKFFEYKNNKKHNLDLEFNTN